MKTKQRARPTAPSTTAPETVPVKVRATRLGYYDHKRRRVGDVFVVQAVVKDGVAELPSWTEDAGGAQLKETGAQAALTVASAEARAMAAAAAAPSASSGDDLGI
jgi:hypothetical protein